MKVAIDVSPLVKDHRFRGIGTYTKCLTQALQDLKDGNDYILTEKPEREKVDVVHYPFFDLFFLTLPEVGRVATVVTIHDVIPLVYPEQYHPGLRGRMKYWVQKQKLGGVNAIITDSEASRRDVIGLMGVDEAKVKRIYLAAADEFAPMPRTEYMAVLKKYGIGRPYLLYVGDINFNKNLPGLIKAYGQVRDRLELVLVSKAMGGDSREAGQIQAMIDDLKWEENIRVLTDVPYEPLADMRGLYSGASWYVQPSFYEGFGLPVLEAMQCETPVVSSIGGSLGEVIGEAAVKFDPDRKGDLGRALRTAVEMSEEKRKELIEKGKEQAAEFSWEKTARETVEVYEKVLG